MKVFFLGTPDFVKPIRSELAKHFTLVDELEDADLLVVAAYGKILTKDELAAPKYGCINIHPSILPKYRGPSPIQSAILNGDKISGITIIKMDEEMDHGSIIYQEEIGFSSSDNFDTLSKKMFQRASEVLPKIIKDFIQNRIKPMPQNDKEAAYCKALKKEDGYFNISNPPPPQKLDRMIRAYYPWPGVWTRQIINGKLSIVKFLPGQKLQVEGGKPMTYKDFLNGYPEAKEWLPNLTN